MPYFHVVFTLPVEVAAVAFQNKTAVYTILFKAAAEMLRTIAADPKHLGAEIGLIAVLHSWGQTLTYHPHCIASCRAVASRPTAHAGSHAGRASSCPCGCCRACSAAAFWRGCGRASTQASSSSSVISPAWSSYPPSPACWPRYAKPPFGRPQQVLAYLGRYTHRVAIANSRLISMADDRVAFRSRDYRHHGRAKLMTLDAPEVHAPLPAAHVA